MKKILQHISIYAHETDKRIFIACSFMMGIGIYLNYTLQLNHIINQQTVLIQFGSWYFIFLTTLSLPYLLHNLFNNENLLNSKVFLALLLTAPLLFAWKMAAYFYFSFTGNQSYDLYWNRILYWPLKLLVILIVLYLFHKIFNKGQPFFGTSISLFDYKPYIWMLLFMIPLIALASTQPDFLRMYPKWQHTLPHSESLSSFQKLLFELSYGSDFIGIEFYFRGFLILAFAKYAGKDAILPMALFYCTIHFGKPLGECISSFFGGLFLGVLTFHTRSIWGGLMVHLGIAWLMELGGYIGNQYF